MATLALHVASLAAQAPVGATAKCADGTYSPKQKPSRGRVRRTRAWRPAMARAAPLKTAKTVPSGATAKCVDGTYSKAESKQGACSSHEGGAQWYGASDKEPEKATPSARAPSGAAAGATARCEDGTYSTAKSPSGACSSHGGVAEWLRDEEAPAGDASHATALCNDRTYSHSQHRSGTCSHHGGVKEWLKSVPN